MKMKKAMNAMLVVAFATIPMLCGQDAPKTNEAPKPPPKIEKPAPKPVDPAVVDKMLAFIPEVAAQADKGVKIMSKEVKDVIKPQLMNAMQNGQEIPQEEIQNFANSVANSMLS